MRGLQVGPGEVVGQEPGQRRRVRGPDGVGQATEPVLRQPIPVVFDLPQVLPFGLRQGHLPGRVLVPVGAEP